MTDLDKAPFFTEQDEHASYPLTQLTGALYTVEQAIRGMRRNDDLTESTVELYREVFGLVQELRLRLELRKGLPAALSVAEVQELPRRTAPAAFWLKSTAARVAEAKASGNWPPRN